MDDWKHTPEQTQLRDELLDDVLHCRRSSSSAELIAHHSGFSLLRKPSIPAEAAFSEASWNVGMVIAWISTRDIRAVAACWPDYVEQCQSWRLLDSGGEVPGPATLITGNFLVAAYAEAPVGMEGMFNIYPGFPPPHDARRRFWKALIDRRLSATTYDLSIKGFRQVDQQEWNVLALTSGPTGEDMLCIAGEKPHLSNIAVDSAQVLEVWPEGVSPHGEPVHVPGTNRLLGINVMTAESPRVVAQLGHYSSDTDSDDVLPPGDQMVANAQNPNAGGALSREQMRIIKACATWLAENYMAVSPDEQTHTKTQIFPEARAKFGALLSKRAFERKAWPGAGKDYPAWTRGGTALSRRRTRGSDDSQ